MQDDRPLGSPRAIAVDRAGNLFVAEMTNTVIGRIRRLDVGTGLGITTIAGNGGAGTEGDNGPATGATFDARSIAVDMDGNLFLFDRLHATVRRVDAVTGTITRVAGNGEFAWSGDGGPATAATLNPYAIAVDPTGNVWIREQAGIVRVTFRRVDAHRHHHQPRRAVWGQR